MADYIAMFDDLSKKTDDPMKNDDVPARFAICLTSGQWGSTSFNQEVYDRIKEEMIDPEDDGKRDYIVNMQWARERIHNMAEKLNE